jgi:hypothetical protein
MTTADEPTWTRITIDGPTPNRFGMSEIAVSTFQTTAPPFCGVPRRGPKDKPVKRKRRRR